MSNELGRAAADLPELRKIGRARLRLPAKIVFGSREFALDCTIRDLSTQGARIAVPNVEIFPERLALIEPLNMFAFESVVRWRRKALFGLEFLKADSLARAVDQRTHLLRMHALNARWAWGY